MRAVGWLSLLVCLALTAGCTGDCSNCVTNTDSGCPGCTPDGGRFTISVIDPTNFSPPSAGSPAQSSVVGFETIPLFQMALAPNGNVGIAYVEFSADQVDNKPRSDGGVDGGDADLFNYDVLYVEWSNGNVVLGPERVTGSVPVQNFVGVSLDYQSNGQPAVALLGWQPTPGYDITQAFWYQHTGVVSYRNLNGGGTPGTWTQETAVDNSGEAACGNPSCDNGTIVGLFPALFIDGAETILAYRDVHFGSSTGTGDFDNSDLEVSYGGPTSWSHFGLAWGKPGVPLPLRSCPTSTGRTAFGSHTKFVHGDSNNPALISDIGGNEYNSNGTNTIFFERTSGTWSCPVSLLKVGVDSNAMVTETGPYMAYDGNPSGQGYAVAITDIAGSGAALYKNCGPGKDCTSNANWSVYRTVYQSGSGGYFASVALNPDTHDPWVAYYFCSSNTSASVSTCPKAERQLQVANSVAGTGKWNAEPVDNQGAWQTQMLYLTNPTKLVIGYRDPASGAMKLAVEKAQ